MGGLLACSRRIVVDKRGGLGNAMGMTSSETAPFGRDGLTPAQREKVAGLNAQRLYGLA